MTERRIVSSGGIAGRLFACGIALLAVTGAGRVGAAVVVTVSTPDGSPGQPILLTVGLQRAAGDPTVTGVQTDVLFDTTQIEIVGACADDQSLCRGDADCGKDSQNNDINCTLPCTNAAQVNAGDYSADLPDTVRPPDEPPTDRLRVAVKAFANPAATYDTGPLVTCAFQVKAEAPVCQLIQLSTDRTVASDPATEVIAGVTSSIIAGSILDETCPTPTPTPTPTLVATETATPPATPTDTPGLPTATPTGEMTNTPGPTNTQRPTNTPTVRPTDTATPLPTNTPTSSVPGGSRRDEDGCAIGRSGGTGGAGLLWCVVPVLMLLRRRYERP